MTLGTSLSGKATIYRQLRALKGHEFTEGEREEVRASILDNLTSASLLIYFRIEDSGIKLCTEAQVVCIA